MYILRTVPEIGTRESRHVNARYQLTTQDIENGARFDDMVCLGAPRIEYHAEPGPPTVWRMGANSGSAMRSTITLVWNQMRHHNRRCGGIVTASRLLGNDPFSSHLDYLWIADRPSGTLVRSSRSPLLNSFRLGDLHFRKQERLSIFLDIKCYPFDSGIV